MQGEQIDNMDELIRAASESHHPAYDDKSWEMMEAMLDKHLPVKKDRRKPFIFFLFFFIASALFIFFYTRPGQQKPATATLQPGLESLHKKASLSAVVAAATDQRVPSAIASDLKPASTIHKVQSPVAPNFNKKAKFTGKKKTKHFFATRITDQATGEGKQDESSSLIQPAINQDKSLVPVSNIDESIDPLTAAATDTINKKDNTVLTAVAITDSAKIQSKRQPVQVTRAVAEVKKGFANNFGLYLSAGPDLSFVGFKNESRGRLNYGAGLSYHVAKRITIRTGFYVAKKTYSASGDDYHPPSSYWTNNADLKNVYADCKIYEIPLSVYYNFKETATQSWFAGVGLSTFLMKRETYDYYYKDAWGQALNKTWTLNNGGNQYFSVLTISGGYQYKVTPWFSLLAEPYFKLPLQGIGFGEIKLNSGGLLFTASIKPFAGKK